MPKSLPKPSLPADATIASALEGLAEPEEYVREVFGKMGKRGEGMQVRISIKSDPEAPDYRVDQQVEEPLDPNDPADLGRAVPIDAYKGSTHRQLSFAKFDDAASWSTEAMSWAQVQALLGRLRAPHSQVAARARR